MVPKPPIPDGRNPAIGKPRSIIFRTKASPSDFIYAESPMRTRRQTLDGFGKYLYLALFLLLTSFRFLFSNYDQLSNPGISLDIFRTQ